MSRLVALDVMLAEIPLRVTIKHASHERTANTTLLVRVELADGSVGWGEGLPREYVTGETPASAWDDADRLQSLVGELLPDFATAAAATESITFANDARQCLGNSVRCAAELALLDAVGRSTRKPLTDYIVSLGGRPPQPVTYSAVLPAASTARKAIYRAVRMRAFGMRHIKVKLALPGHDDAVTLARYGRWLGRRIQVADANEGWNPAELPGKLALLARHGLTVCEQPIPHARIDELPRDDAGVAIMLDESFCSQPDLDAALAAGRARMFNVRLSKCGGITRSLALVRNIEAASTPDRSLGMQLGCQVGETAILSAAGRAVASCVPAFRFVEGSYDRFLVQQPLSREDITFTRGGYGPVLDGPGLGITIDEEAVAGVTKQRKRFD